MKSAPGEQSEAHSTAVTIAERLRRLPRQLLRRSPFQGDIAPSRVPLFAPFSGRPTLPFPTPWNYHRPLDLLSTYYHGAERLEGAARHSRYLEVPGFSPVLVTRDPRVIRAIASETGDKPGQFDRDTLPTGGIARATGADTLLYANGATWKRQKRLSTPPFARTTLFQPEYFSEFEVTFRQTVGQRLAALRERLSREPGPLRVELAPEIEAVMLEMLVNNFFGAQVPYRQIREKYAPALARIIHHIVRDTVVNKTGCPMHRLPTLTRGIASAKAAQADFEELTDLAIAPRAAGKGLWKQFKSEADDKALRANVMVFLAGALEATTSYASWAIAHLARNALAQERVHAEVKDVNAYSPEALEKLTYLAAVLDETLRLSPALYFLPRRATADTWVETTDGSRMFMPKGTHVLLDVWHANRHEDHWGEAVTGYPAMQFAPERWQALSKEAKSAKDLLHFGFGHGPRFCPGKSLGQLEVALVVGAFVKLFRFRAMDPALHARAGVSTKPGDRVSVQLELRP
ncbi:MAG: cytochrome P450 [Phycisphaerae bacterium]|nr:cytochrome P450 [Phycisphaerae bacterium]